MLKEGVWEDNDHRKDLAPLLRFRSSAVEGLTSLADYVGRMKDGQEAIYVLAGDNAEALSRSAQLEGFRARGIEVLLLTDPIDAFWPERMDEFDGKPIRSVTQGAADLSKLAPAETPAGEAADVTALVAALKAALGDAVAEVRATDRLVDSAVVLAAGTAGPDLQMQRLLRRAGRAGLRRAAGAGDQPAPPADRARWRRRPARARTWPKRPGCCWTSRASRTAICRATRQRSRGGWRRRWRGGDGMGGARRNSVAPSGLLRLPSGRGRSLPLHAASGGNRRRMNSITSIPGTAQAIAST